MTKAEKMKKNADPLKFKVGDRVETDKYGPGQIHQVDENDPVLPYFVHFDNGYLDWPGPGEITALVEKSPEAAPAIPALEVGDKVTAQGEGEPGEVVDAASDRYRVRWPQGGIAGWYDRSELEKASPAEEAPGNPNVAETLENLTERTRAQFLKDGFTYREVTTDLQEPIGLGLAPDAPTTTNAHGGKQSASPYRSDLLPGHALLTIAKVLKRGADKYGADNWHLIPVAEHINHALSHLLARRAGDETDDHLANAACRILFALDQRESGRDAALRRTKENLDAITSEANINSTLSL